MKRLLIVDDSKIIRRRIERSYGLEDYAVVGAAEDGSQAVKMAKQLSPHLITMDLTMPNMDGSDAIRELSSLCPDARILVVSALSDKATAIDSLSRGAHGFLCKPFTDEELREALHELTSD